MHHNLIIKDGDTTKVVKEVLVDGIQFVDDRPRAGSTNPVTSDGVAKANADIFDDGDRSGEEEEVDGSAYYNSHEVGKFYFERGMLWKCTDKTRDGELGSYTYTTTIVKMNGVVDIVNDIVDRNVALDDRITAIENS